MRSILFALAALTLVAGCRRTDVRDFTIDVPGMSEADVPAVVAALAPYGGIERASIKFDAKTKKIDLRYDSMQIAKKNIEMAIAKIGFSANGVTPESIGAKSKK